MVKYCLNVILKYYIYKVLKGMSIFTICWVFLNIHLNILYFTVTGTNRSLSPGQI